eukprot:TRINITY_DN11068_c0_g1_i1.p1 TRINITY_DN11068_c0_g1~~TRINITY_DN11068_c0_g1_i1.p1  ORF type:complete len:453 (-),score=63.88 TRINITY_DN11068_c0_g1_i1:105-1463(-)
MGNGNRKENKEDAQGASLLHSDSSPSSSLDPSSPSSPITDYPPVISLGCKWLKMKKILPLESFKLNLLAISDDYRTLYIASGSSVVEFKVSDRDLAYCKDCNVGSESESESMDDSMEDSEEFELKSKTSSLLFTETGIINSILWGKDSKGPYLLIALENDCACLRRLDPDLVSDKVIYPSPKSVWSLSVHSPSSRIAFGSNSHRVNVAYSNNGNAFSPEVVDTHEHNVPSISFSPGGRYIASVGIDSFLYVTEIETKVRVLKVKLRTWGWNVQFVHKESASGFVPANALGDMFDVGLVREKPIERKLPSHANVTEETHLPTKAENLSDYLLLVGGFSQLTLFDGEDGVEIESLDPNLHSRDEDDSGRNCLVHYIPELSLILSSNQGPSFSLTRIEEDLTSGTFSLVPLWGCPCMAPVRGLARGPLGDSLDSVSMFALLETGVIRMFKLSLTG